MNDSKSVVRLKVAKPTQVSPGAHVVADVRSTRRGEARRWSFYVNENDYHPLQSELLALGMKEGQTAEITIQVGKEAAKTLFVKIISIMIPADKGNQAFAA